MNYFDKMKEKTTAEIIGTIIGSIVGTFLAALIVMLLWNYVAVALFALPRIGYWMAFCLHWLCRCLFKGK